ncbi:MAG: hypothetical protein HS108_08605 [Planctomycetes bacterium]|nr:hypothetical protein [Planctomycetota bacterium]MCL4730093.1 hypothetical protein [Planctomycetota bacterium]
MKILSLLKLVRLSALPSALADVPGGMALAVALGPVLGLGHVGAAKLPWLILATTGIYLGGMAGNDVLHARKDSLLGKARPIVTGELGIQTAWTVTCLLYAAGLVGAIMAGCAGPALLLAALTFLYNRLAAGRVTGTRVTQPAALSLAAVAVIALCRALHVLLPLLAHLPPGFALTRLLNTIAPLFAASVFVYFALVTVISLFEDTGGGRRALAAVQVLLTPVPLVLPLVVLARPGVAPSIVLGVLAPLLVAAALVLNLWRALDTARQSPTPPNLGKAVGAGIRGECLLMAAFALALAPMQPWWGLGAAALYPVGRVMARWVSPT